MEPAKGRVVGHDAREVIVELSEGSGSLQQSLVTGKGYS